MLFAMLVRSSDGSFEVLVLRAVFVFAYLRCGSSEQSSKGSNKRNGRRSGSRSRRSMNRMLVTFFRAEARKHTHIRSNCFRFVFNNPPQLMQRTKLNSSGSWLSSDCLSCSENALRIANAIVSV